MGWRAMASADLMAVSAISDAVHGHYTEPMAIYAERLTLYAEGCFLFEREGMPCGYLITHPWRHEGPPPLGALIGAIPVEADSYYLHDLALLPAARGTGAGGEGVRLAMEQAGKAGFRDVYLLAVNGADSFWTLQGFTIVPGEKRAAQLRADYGPEVLYMHRRLP